MSDTVGKLTWRASTSKDVVCYRVYWSLIGPVNYDCPCWATRDLFLNLPCGGMTHNLRGRTIYLGVAAVDKHGNISDIIQRRVFISTKQSLVKTILNKLKNLFF